MNLVLGIDFGTLNVRVSIFDDIIGHVNTAIAAYPLHRSRDDLNFATQSHEDHLRALTEATHRAISTSAINPASIKALAIDTTGSSVVIVDEVLNPLDDYYMWCDHRAWREASEITAAARRYGLEAILWCGGTYSSEWGFSKVLHWLRHNPHQRSRVATAIEHCDMITSTLCGISDLDEIPRSVCAMGHKWMWNDKWGGLPPDEFFTSVDPLLAGIRAKVSRGRFRRAGIPAGTLSPGWAKRLGLPTSIPVAVGALDAHWDAIAAGIRLGDAVNVIGTSTCIIGMSDAASPVPGICGVVPGSVHPDHIGLEAGLSATGDIFDSIARRAGTKVANLSKRLEGYRGGQTGLLRLTWDNGDRTVLTNPELGGVTLGWNLMHGPEDELFAAIEGTALHTRVILDHMQAHNAPVRRVINGGGIPGKNSLLNQVYANALDIPVLVPRGNVTGMGAAIFAFVCAGVFPSVEVAQEALCPEYEIFEPEIRTTRIYQELYGCFRRLYFGLGETESCATDFTGILSTLRRLALESQQIVPIKS